MTLRPGRLDEVIDGIRGSAPKPLLFRSGGTKLDWGRPLTADPCVLDSKKLNGILEHDPGDMTATVLAGTSLEGLQRALAPHRQWLAIDPPLGPDREATVGGIFSAQDSGPSRLAYGSLRELVIGMTVVLSDGTVARSGGKVIKNVAGYDLCKLFCGALGTLGFVYTLTVRVHPLPESRKTIEIRGDYTPRAQTAAWFAGSMLEPAAVELLDGKLLVRFDGTSARVERQTETALQEVAARGLDGRVLESVDEDRAWDAVSTAISGQPRETVVRVAAHPSRWAETRRAVHEAAEHGGVAVAHHCHAALGLHTLRLSASDREEGHVTYVERLRTELGGWGRAVVRRRPEVVGAELDPLGPRPGAAFLMERLRNALDPQGRCAPGRLEWGPA